MFIFVCQLHFSRINELSKLFKSIIRFFPIRNFCIGREGLCKGSQLSDTFIVNDGDRDVPNVIFMMAVWAMMTITQTDLFIPNIGSKAGQKITKKFCWQRFFKSSNTWRFVPPIRVDMSWCNRLIWSRTKGVPLPFERT